MAGVLAADHGGERSRRPATPPPFFEKTDFPIAADLSSPPSDRRARFENGGGFALDGTAMIDVDLGAGMGMGKGRREDGAAAAPVELPAGLLIW
ncbi:hypothetical protein OG455_08505 [Kitasatospora sp. NBC_01287]|uniref:hypothetical protein n=1 Tax=Kitasatospora sp. NBC_01287 TaxID=2903573 RepID=UPI0022581296|nr:hypothetical protein [Kitasatospora sp. NBC_01287]MCX4745563.1 hypothetical protein [Kitasatospora sp. NBC_01287]